MVKKFIISILTLVLILAVVTFTGCFTPAPQTPNTPTEPTEPTEPSEPQEPIEPSTPFTPHESAKGLPDRSAAASEYIVDFANGSSDGFYWANGYSNGGMFNCTWRSSSAKVENGIMSMTVSKEGNGYAGAEYRTNNRYSYGFFSVCMKPANCSGIVSSFFTYTNDPVWDEIDIEFLGKDMTQVQFNYYTNGVGGHEFVLDLGFDASEDFHEYSFDYQKDSITWYVDGKAVYRATQNLPSHPMQIMANVWNCIGIDSWTGPLDESKLPATAEYKFIAYSPNAE